MHVHELASRYSLSLLSSLIAQERNRPMNQPLIVITNTCMLAISRW